MLIVNLAAASYAFIFDTGQDNGILNPYAGECYLSGSVSPGQGQGSIKNHGVLLSATWYPISNIPYPTYYGGGVCYQRNDTGWIYVIGGNGTGTGTNRALRYNANTNVWQSLQDLPAPLRGIGTAVIKDSIYSFGGISPSGTYTNALYLYSITDNSWSSRKNLPVLMGYSKGVGFEDSLIYTAGGSNGTIAYNNVFLYNANSDTWRAATPLPSPRVGGAFSRSGDTLVYIGGAEPSGAIYNTTFKGVISRTDRSIIQWTTGTAFPAGPMFRMDAQPWGCKGIIITGGSSQVLFTSVSNACYSYSPGLNSWAQQPNKPTSWTCGQSGTFYRQDGTWELVCASGWGGQSILYNTEVLYELLGCNLTGITNSSNIPGTYELKQNFPNPFNPETGITFMLPARSMVSLTVYDVSGKEVAELVNKQLNAGNFTIKWKAENYPSGVYFYRIRAESVQSKGVIFQQTKKMMLIK